MAIFARKVKSYDLYSSHAWYVPGVRGMFALLAMFLVGALLSGIVMAILMVFMTPQAIADYGMIVVYPVQFLPAMIYAATKSHKNALFDPGYKVSSNNFGTLGLFGAIGLTIVLTYATMFAADPVNWGNATLTEQWPWLKKMYELVMETMKTMTGGPLWASFLVTAIFAPVFEEWLCRGMILRGLLVSGKMKPGWAIVVSAIFFAVIHMNPWQAVNAFILGLLMGYIYYKTGNLWLTMLVHFLNNGTAVILSNIPSLSENDYWIQILSAPVYWTVVAVSILLVVCGIRLFKTIPVKNPWGNIDQIETQV